MSFLLSVASGFAAVIAIVAANPVHESAAAPVVGSCARCHSTVTVNQFEQWGRQWVSGHLCSECHEVFWGGLQ